jgi:hypothetical protein
MPDMSKQATTDGNVVDGYDPPFPTMAEREAIVIQGFEARGWKIEEKISKEPERKTILTVSRGERSYKLQIYIFPNLAYSKPRNVEIKRIQISRPYAEHQTDFELPDDGMERCLLLGIYTQNGKSVVCAWNASEYRDHGLNGSCYVRVPAIADAMRTGFQFSIDTKDHVACCFQPDLIAYYLENMCLLHNRALLDQGAFLDSVSADDEASGSGSKATDADIGKVSAAINALSTGLPRNRILYGAPGTGKSYRLEGQVKELFSSDELHERVTFHPDYTYGQFVGTYRPVPKYKETGTPLLAADKLSEVGSFEPVIDYVFVPGPFLRLLIKALKNPKHNFVLIIEELNRANAPAVFGEVFQLLDRDDGGAGTFTAVMPTEAQDYLRSIGLEPSVRLPANLYLWATMNSADQGVMPLDAAFKRRWSFEYVPLDEDQGKTAEWKIHLNFLGGNIPWNTFRAAINDHLKKRGTPEDRLIGPFFMKRDELESGQAFKNKLLLYLRDDVVRHNPENLFRGSAPSYGALVDAYDDNKPIFAEEIEFGAASSES